MGATNITSLLYDAALALFYPQPCAVCGASVESRFDGVACTGCWNETRVFDGTEILCWKCGALSLAGIAPEQREEVRCRRCDSAAFTAARACGLYEGALRACTLALKRQPHITRRIAASMFGSYQRAPLNRATRIVPVPLHPEREKVCGFNQAAVLARELSRRARLPLCDKRLIRTAHTALHRGGMDAQARRESVENVFAVRRPEAISGERILLVDDVFTTGATVSACASVLLAAGAKEVLVLTVARPADA